ncbi:MAG TPA: uroporphyrinogen decarboxylase [Candidatus Dormibacteraeota bacterium]|nr:uroporphyrinogen decarboxylase [Candidatus Dormibacteraeota bacterium]
MGIRGGCLRAMAPVASSVQPFLQACRREPTDFTPIWLMRQAGRYLPDYRRIRERLSFLDLCRDSDTAAEVTVSTVRRLGVDAAIIFADILLPLVPMGLGLRFEKGDGPHLDRPLRGIDDIDRLPIVNVAESLSFVAQSIKLARAELLNEVPVIGFAGAPFTLASYAVEGGSSRNFVLAKTMMYREPNLWHRLMTYLADLTADYLNLQIDAGADAVQLFDSWVGCLCPEDYRDFALPYTKRVVAALHSRVPVIYFGTMTNGLLELMQQTGADVIGIDWRIDLETAFDRLHGSVAIQGNLDPVKLFADASEIRTSVRNILARVSGRPGHIFNLGHGVLPGTPVENVLTLIDAVHEYSAK